MISSIAVAAGVDDARRWFTASSFPGFHSTTEPVTPVDRELLDLFADHDLDLKSARTVVDTHGRRLAIASSASGEICYSAAIEGKAVFGACFHQYQKTGLTVGHLSGGTNRPAEVFGLISEGTSDIVITTSDGVSHHPDAANSAFWWTAPSVAAVESITATKNGKRVVDESSFRTK